MFLSSLLTTGVSGTEVGTCPDMQMNVSTQFDPCEGYEYYSTIVISYVGSNFSRRAYLPNSQEGQELLKLLEIAFERRLCFTIGTSNTTGQDNAIVWNIHHKSSNRGGVTSHGFPDPDYLNRLRLELKSFGIE